LFECLVHGNLSWTFPPAHTQLRYDRDAYILYSEKIWQVLNLVISAKTQIF